MSLIDTDSEDEMPAGWEERTMLDGRVYYANHETKTTQWTHPCTGCQKRVVGELPYGWEQTCTDDGVVLYVDHVNEKTTYTDPRLAFAIEENKNGEDIRQKYDASSTALQVLHGRDLTGKVVIVTGGNCGIGFETVRSLAFHGAHVILACRNLETANDAIQKISAEKSNLSLEAIQLDLSSLKNVQEFATNFQLKHQFLHILILNAGVFGASYSQTADGYEQTFQINHLSHFYLTQLLEPVLIRSAPSRVVVVSSESHRASNLSVESLTSDKLSAVCASQYSAFLAYNNSKLCNIVFANALDCRLKDKQVRCYSLHPGNMVRTNVSRSWWLYRLLFLLFSPFTKSVQQAAATTVYCATDPRLDNHGGLYFNNCCQCPISKLADQPTISNKLWKLSNDMIQRALSSNSS